jgi:hypothetical protein
VEHDIGWSFSTQPDIRQHYSGEHIKDYEREMLAAAMKRSGVVRQALFFAARLVVFSSLAGFAIGWLFHRYLGSIPPLLNSVLQVTGAGTLLWATIWQLGADVRTMGGESLVERVHSWLFRGLYILGTVLFFVAYAWSL